MPKITFFVEAPQKWVNPEERTEDKERTQYIREMLYQEYGEETVLSYLAKKEYSLAIATGILDKKYAELIKDINHAGVLVTHWIVVDDNQGYWTNACSLEATKDKIEKLLNWQRKYNLGLAKVGLDIEWPLQVARAFSSNDFARGLRLFWEYRKNIPKNAQEEFEKLLQLLRVKATPVQFYEFPKILGWFFPSGLKIPKNAEVVEMDYSSMLPKILVLLLMKVFRSKKRIPALGIINGVSEETPGRMLGPQLPRHLTAEDLRKDIEAVGQQDEIYLFALNGVKVIDLLEEAIA